MPIEKPLEKRFIFSGGGTAFAGRIRRPDNVFLQSIAPSYLPTTGGSSHTLIEGPDAVKHHYKDFFSFTAAHSRALADYSDPRKASEFTHGNHSENSLAANTIVEAHLDGLQIKALAQTQDGTPQRIFSAKALDAHMESSIKRTLGHPVSFHSFSALFDTLSLTSGEGDSASTVDLKVHTITSIFNEHDTFDKLQAAYSGDRDFRHKYASCFHPPGTDLPGILGNMVGNHEIPHAKEHGWIVATFVTHLSWLGKPPEGTEILNNRLTISGLGRIYFGEVVIFDTLRSVTLLRFELGSDTGGDATAVQVDSRSIHFPPGN
jgi:hypothetical protein